MTHSKASKPSSLCAHVRRAGTWVFQGYCEQERMALDGHSVECHPQGSLKSWRVTAKGYRWDGSTQFLDAEVNMDGEGLMVAWTPGFAHSASFDPSAFFKMLAEERPMNLACTLARLPAMTWDERQERWERVDEARVTETAARRAFNRGRIVRPSWVDNAANRPTPPAPGTTFRHDPAKSQPDGSMPPAADFSEVL